jgi:hypothetical protein
LLCVPAKVFEMNSKSLFISLHSAIHERVYEDSENGIQKTIESLAWNDSIYRTFNEGLHLAKSKARRKRIPKSLVDYVHRAHLSYVVITLRKLYDDKKEGTRAVNSLRTVTQKILDNLHLFTRENYLTYDDTPYEADDSLDWRTNAVINGRHRQFDLLANLLAGFARSPKDMADPFIARQLHENSVLRTEIDSFANKFLAHSAARRNRPDERLTFANLSLLRIQAQYRNVIWSAQQIGKYLCDAVLNEVATPQFDVLADWESGLFDQRMKRKLYEYWDGRMKWWRKWSNYYRSPRKLFKSPGERF